MANNAAMKFSEWVSGQRGRSLAVAQAVGVTPPVVSDWATGKKGIPVERCVAIERATAGAVTRKDLRPDDWQDIWPELAKPSAAAEDDPAAPRIPNPDWPRPEEQGVTHV
jgi:DNA-binding transcriptional regulator YdaS (Cro superfamily)